MRRLTLMITVFGLLAGPALADLDPSAYNPAIAGLTPTGEQTVGVYAPPTTTAGPYIRSDFDEMATPGQTIQLTFGFHWLFATAVNAVEVQHSFVYDNSEVSVLSMTPVGLFAGGAHNYPTPAEWQGATYNPGSGTIVVGDVLGAGAALWANPAAGAPTVVGSAVIPFMQVNLEVEDGVNPDAILDAVLGSAAVYFMNGTQTLWTGGAVGSVSHGMNTIPEPASLTLLGLGLVSIGTGAWRRRRR